MVQLHQPDILQQVAALDAQLLVISFADLTHLQAWIPYFVDNFLVPNYAEQNLSLPPEILARTRFVADPERKVYRAYGLGRTTSERVFGFKILRQYAKWKLQGKPIRKITDDPMQRGGNFVVNRAARLTLSHTGYDQSERPSPAEILAALAKLD